LRIVSWIIADSSFDINSVMIKPSKKRSVSFGWYFFFFLQVIVIVVGAEFTIIWNNVMSNGVSIGDIMGIIGSSIGLVGLWFSSKYKSDEN